MVARCPPPWDGSRIPASLLSKHAKAHDGASTITAAHGVGARHSSFLPSLLLTRRIRYDGRANGALFDRRTPETVTTVRPRSPAGISRRPAARWPPCRVADARLFPINGAGKTKVSRGISTSAIQLVRGRKLFSVATDTSSTWHSPRQ